MTAGDGVVVDLRDDGLLWLINATCFHPRGFALAIREMADGDEFVLMGDGTEPWRYASAADVEARGGDPSKAVDIDALFAKVEAMFARARVASGPGAVVDGNGGLVAPE